MEKKNITSIDNCITRLRLEIKDNTLVDESVIKSAGVAGVIRPGKTSVQVIIGTQYSMLQTNSRNYVNKNYII